MGDYYTSPGGTGDPSRTAVDLDGNLWIANRADHANGGGSVTKIGLVIGGTRCDRYGVEDENGDYLKPPFIYNTCCDRDGDGLIRTSRGYNHQLPWMAPEGAAREPAHLYLADDECICQYERVRAEGTRFLAVDRDNNVWTGSQLDREFDFLDTAADTVTPAFEPELGGYGGLFALYPSPKGLRRVIWSTSNNYGTPTGYVLRYDLDEPAAYDSEALRSYGIGMDRDGNVWVAQHDAGTLRKFYPDGTFDTVDHAGGHAYGPKGVAVRLADNSVWVVKTGRHQGRHYISKLVGGYVQNYPLGGQYAADTEHPTGVAVDRADYVWTTCEGGDTAKRVSATGHVDTIESDAGSGPYSFSNMTGDVTLHSTGAGTWNVIHDSGAFGAPWHLAVWNRENCIAGDEIPELTALTVEIRASDVMTELPSLPYVQVGRAEWIDGDFVEVGNGTWFEGVTGRFLEVRVRFMGTVPGQLPSPETFRTPTLCDLKITSALADMNCDGAVNTFDIDPFVLAMTSETQYAENFPFCNYMNGDVNCDGSVNVFDIDPFVLCLTSGESCCQQ